MFRESRRQSSENPRVLRKAVLLTSISRKGLTCESGSRSNLVSKELEEEEGDDDFNDDDVVVLWHRIAD